MKSKIPVHANIHGIWKSWFVFESSSPQLMLHIHGDDPGAEVADFILRPAIGLA